MSDNEIHAQNIEIMRELMYAKRDELSQMKNHREIVKTQINSFNETLNTLNTCVEQLEDGYKKLICALDATERKLNHD